MIRWLPRALVPTDATNRTDGRRVVVYLKNMYVDHLLNIWSWFSRLWRRLRLLCLSLRLYLADQLESSFPRLSCSIGHTTGSGEAGHTRSARTKQVSSFYNFSRTKQTK